MRDNDTNFGGIEIEINKKKKNNNLLLKNYNNFFKNLKILKIWKYKMDNTGSATSTPVDNLITDPITLERRRKQIEYGKNTPEYQNYLNAVPK